MASVWYAVLVLLSLEQVLARDCSDYATAKSCDECIRCGKQWCEDPAPGQPRCHSGRDVSCRTAALHHLQENRTSSDLMDPVFWTSSVAVGRGGNPMKVNFKSGSKINYSLISSSIGENLSSKFMITPGKISCDTQGCFSEISAMPNHEFCPANGSEDESITVQLRVDDDEALVAKAVYHVPCACQCSKTVERSSATCNGHGDLSCGICTCHEGWKGEFCDRKQLREHPEDVAEGSRRSSQHEGGSRNSCDRGDVPVCDNCSEFGYCDCSTGSARCICDTNKGGSQYFDEFCTDICTITNYHDSCLLTDETGYCTEGFYQSDKPIYREPKNKTVLNDVDYLNRKIWITCHLKNDSCLIEYAAMKVEDEIHVMILDLCGTTQEGLIAGKVNVTVPVVLGVLALLATTAAVAGYMFWKHRTPPLPGADPQYTNIEAQDSTGVNPLYIPPTSSFKNPTYGKW